MKNRKKIIAASLLLCALLLACMTGCGPQGGDQPDASAGPGSSAPSAPSGQEDGDTPENGGEPAQSKTLDFSRLGGVGNNLLNLATCNNKIASDGRIVSDDSYIYFCEKNSYDLWRMKLDGSGLEMFLEDAGHSLNLVNGELYYVNRSSIKAVNLNTKEVRTVVENGGKNIRQILVVGDRVYWSAAKIAVQMASADGSEPPVVIYSNYGDIAENLSYRPMELTTDGEKLYFFIANAISQTDARLYVYEMDLNASGADAQMTEKGSMGKSGSTHIECHDYSLVFGANGFLANKFYSNQDNCYEALLYDDLSGEMKMTSEPWIQLGVPEQPWLRGLWPKLVLGNTMFGLYTDTGSSKLGENATAQIYMMQNMDVTHSEVVYSFPWDNLAVGGVCGDKLYIIEKDGDAMKLTTIDENGNVA